MGEAFRLVLALSLSGSVLILALFALRPLLRDRLPRSWQYYLWIIVLLRLVIPFTPSLGLHVPDGLLRFMDGAEAQRPVISAAPVAKPTGTAVPASVDPAEPAGQSGGAVTANKPAVPAETVPAETARAVSLQEALGWCWLTGAALLLLIKAVRYTALTRKLRVDARPVTDGKVLRLLHMTAGSIGLTPIPALYITEGIGSPLLLGLLRPVVLLPEAVIENGSALTYILRHELTHARRRDILYKWCVELVLCVHWFNPLAHLMARQIARACELSCDEAVAYRLDADGRLAYGTAVLNAAEHAALCGRLLSAGLRGDKTNLKERLGTILKTGPKSKRATLVAIALALCLLTGGVLLGACASGGTGTAASPSSTPNNTPSPDASAQQEDTAEVRTLVDSFGKVLKNVSLMAPSDDLNKSIDDNYAAYVSPELLEAWKADPMSAPGRLTSSPWPDSIMNIGAIRNEDGSYTVSGAISNMSSPEVRDGNNYGFGFVQNVTVTVTKSGGSWLISGWSAEEPSLLYTNIDYGFAFKLPYDWLDYTVVTQEWQGAYDDGSAKPGISGPQLLLRSPKWTKDNPTQDIPIMVFTLRQWNDVISEALSVSAAPVPPTELGRNSFYVFALPARYNFAYLPGYEDVEKIISSAPMILIPGGSVKPSEEAAPAGGDPAPSAVAEPSPTAAPSEASVPSAVAYITAPPEAASPVPSSAPVVSDILSITYNGKRMEDVTMTVGDAVTFTYSTTSLSTDDVPIWSTDDSSVAAVSGGVVTAMGKGTTTLTLKLGDSTAKCIIRVR